MKNKKIQIFALIAFIFSILICNTVNAEEIPENAELYELNWKQSLLASDITTKIKDYYKDNFPSYYGGIYLRGEERDIVLQIVKENVPSNDSEDYEFYNSIVKYDDSVKIEYVENSFAELSRTNKMLGKIISSNRNIYKDVNSNYIDVMNNKVGIDISSDDKNMENQILDLLENNDIVKFNENTEPNITQATLKAGARYFLTSNPNNGSCSVGFRVNYLGNGYVTAGHCVQGLTYVPTGDVVIKRFADGENYDYAFIRTYSSYTPSNSLVSNKFGYTYLAVVNYSPVLTVGAYIAKDGWKSGWTTGYITALDTHIYYSNENKTIYGLVTSTVSSQGGDSGSPVFFPRTDSNGGSIPIGVLSGNTTAGNSMYFTSINSLLSVLQRY